MKLAEIRSKIPKNVELLAVSKFQPLEKILALYHRGQKQFAENYVQELVEKARLVQEQKITDLEFHFIGKLQRNKVKALLPWVTTIHSLDSFSLIQEIEKQAAALQKKISVYVQINIDREESKSGLCIEELPEIIRALKESKCLKPLGLMAIPDPEKDAAQAFQEMQNLSKKYQKDLGSGLSMGMSSDYELAIRYGSTCVRVGTALFGERPPK